MDSWDGARPLVVLEHEGTGAGGRSNFGGWGNEGNEISVFETDGSVLRRNFREFFRTFRLGNVYIYRDALMRHWNREEYFIEVDLAHVSQFDEGLFNNLQV